MSEKKQLNEEQLEKVNGGDWAEEHSQYLPAGYGAHIGKDDAKNHIGSDVYVVDDGYTKCWCWGTLNESNGTIHKVYVKGKGDYYDGYTKVCSCEIGDTVDFVANDHTLFLKN